MDLIERFKALVVIDNPSGQEAAIRDYIGRTLAEVGVQDQTVDAAGNLLVRVPGQVAGETILLSAHMDSVPPCNGIEPVEELQDGQAVIRSAGRTILGADDKSGIATILTLVGQLAADGFAHNHPLELLFSTGEEVGLIGAKAFDRSLLQSQYGYVLDGEGLVGEIFNAGASQESLLITVHGKRSHAGILPEEGISAIQVAAHLCTQLPSGRISERTTTNLGVIQGGEAMNVVPPLVTIRGEARSHSQDELAALLEQYRSACQATEARYPGAKIEFLATRRYDAYVVDPAGPAVRRAEAACQQLGLVPQVKPMSIGSDAHILNLKGLPTVVLGMGFHYSHSLGEYIVCDAFRQVYQLVYRLVAPTAP